MQVRNISDHARAIASPTHDFYSADIEPQDTVEVSDELGVSLCEQVDIWAPVKIKADKALKADASADKEGE